MGHLTDEPAAVFPGVRQSRGFSEQDEFPLRTLLPALTCWFIFIAFSSPERCHRSPGVRQQPAPEVRARVGAEGPRRLRGAGRPLSEFVLNPPLFLSGWPRNDL